MCDIEFKERMFHIVLNFFYSYATTNKIQCLQCSEKYMLSYLHDEIKDDQLDGIVGNILEKWPTTG